jgi:hypothetical protein
VRQRLAWYRRSAGLRRGALALPLLAALALAATGTPPVWLLTLGTVALVLLALGSWLLVAHVRSDVRGRLPTWCRWRRVAPLLRGWLRTTPAAAAAPAAAVAWLHLGDTAQPLLARLDAPALHVELREAVPVLHLADRRPISVALYHSRVVAIRYRYPLPLRDVPMSSIVADAERCLSPASRASQQYQLQLRADGWLLTTPDCPPACRRAVDGEPEAYQAAP